MVPVQRCVYVMAVSIMAVLLWADWAAAADIRSISPRKAESLLQANPSVIVLDIRTPREFRAGHIAGAKNINFYSKSFRSRLAKLDRNTTYLMHCRRGVRSGNSLKVFRDLGFKNIIHMPAGMDGWKRAKLHTVRR